MTVRTWAAALATTASIAAGTATPAMAENTYSVDGSATKGGTPSKPKAAKLTVIFNTGTTLGETFQPKPVVKFKINIEGGRLNATALKHVAKCKATPPDSDDPSADQCPPRSVVGAGVLTVLVGQPETVFNPALKCDLPFNLYNLGSKGSLGLFIDAKPPTCPLPVKQWVIVKTTQVGRTVSSTIEVPKALQELAPNTFATVVKSTVTFKSISVKVKGKRQSVTESVGCADPVRTMDVEFTDIDGGTGRASKNLPCR